MAVPVPKAVIETGSNKGIGGRGGSKSKRSGNYFEHATAQYFNTDISKAKRIVGSGALGRITRDPTLLGDVKIDFDILEQGLLVDCKFGYGGKSQIGVKREWLEKIAEEAAYNNRYPAVMCKFKGARGDQSRLVIFTWDTYMSMMKELSEYINRLREESEMFIESYVRETAGV